MPCGRPNVVFIMTDQQRCDTMGAYGNNVIKTPHLDNLAEQSALLENFFVTNPVCVPSRASFFTGRYPTAHRSRDLTCLLAAEEVSLPDLLQEAGYALGLSGKNHVLPPDRIDKFDQVMLVGHDKQWIPAQEYSFGSGVDPTDLVHYSTTVVRDHAVEFLRAQSSLDQPFFHWISFPDPHTPYQVPEPFGSMYDPDDVPSPRGGPQELEVKPAAQRRVRDAQEMEEASARRLREMIAIYYGMVSCVDDAVGDILGELHRLGLERDTVVIFSADHGEYLGDHGLVRKSLDFYDCLLRVPLLVRYPNEITPKRISGTLGSSVDLLPTLLDLVGLETPAGVQGTSMLPVLSGDEAELRQRVFATVGNPGEGSVHRGCPEGGGRGERFVPYWHAGATQGAMVRTLDWKLGVHIDGSGELYDVRNDPNELDNLYGDPCAAAVREEMMKELLMAQMHSEDPRVPR